MPTITAPNSWRLAQRFVWKEYRMLRELALGVIGLALVAMLFVQTVSAESVRASAVLLVAIGAAAMTAIAAAVTLFSVETEEGTAELLRILPHQRRAQFLGKVSAGIVSATFA
jgi:ABC-type transport system involved in cytochrome c biogenesis permease component